VQTLFDGAPAQQDCTLPLVSACDSSAMAMSHQQHLCCLGFQTQPALCHRQSLRPIAAMRQKTLTDHTLRVASPHDVCSPSQLFTLRTSAI